MQEEYHACESGIYGIVNTVNGLIYVGSAVKIKRRWSDHRQMLGRGAHDNSYLQHAWNLYGAAAFEFRVLEEVSNPALLLEREQAWMEQTGCTDRARGYNLRPQASSQRGFRFTDEQRARMSASHRGRPQTPATVAARFANRVVTEAQREASRANGRARRGQTLTPEHRAKIVRRGEANGRAKLSVVQVREIKRRLTAGESGVSLARELGLGQSTISDIKCGRRWRDVS
jgi:group I intron endonuclease